MCKHFIEIQPILSTITYTYDQTIFLSSVQYVVRWVHSFLWCDGHPNLQEGRFSSRDVIIISKVKKVSVIG